MKPNKKFQSNSIITNLIYKKIQQVYSITNLSRCVLHGLIKFLLKGGNIKNGLGGWFYGIVRRVVNR